MQSIKSLLDTPIRGKTILKAAAVCFLGLAVFVCAVEAFIFFSMRPPRENGIIADFQLHSSAYERLKSMLLEDDQVSEISTAGIETPSSLLKRSPSEVHFPISRYNEYVTLLNKIGRGSVFRMKEKESNLVCVVAWGAGWAGDTRHMWVCWADRPPSNEVGSLDSYYRNPRRQHNAFRRIDGHWYLRADW